MTFDRVMDALGDVQRRRLLLALAEHDSVDYSQAFDTGGGKTAQNEQMYLKDADQVKMRHVHLPKLAEYGFINWDRENERVRRGEKFNTIKPLIQLFDSHEGKLPSDWT